MRKLSMFVSILIIAGCAGVIPVKAKEPIKADLETFCKAKASLMESILGEVAYTNRHLHGMIREDTGDFVPVLFAQFKMENLSIILYSTLVEVLRTAKDGEVFNITFSLLDQYIELIRYDLIKVKMFEGMIDGPRGWGQINKDRLVLRTVGIHLKTGYDLLVDIKKGLEDLK